MVVMVRVVVVAAALVLVPTAPASAVTAALEVRAYSQCETCEVVLHDVLVVRGGDGQSNRLVATQGETARVIFISDPGAPISAGSGCRRTGLISVVCTKRDASHDEGSEWSTGSGDDFIVLRTLEFPAVVDAGPGNDYLVAPERGGGDLKGGSGADRLEARAERGVVAPTVSSISNAVSLDGGVGSDVVRAGGRASVTVLDTSPPEPDRFEFTGAQHALIYQRRHPLRFDLANRVGGAPGENDRWTQTTAPILQTGSADDVVVGSDGDDFVSGGPGGVDHLDGREGNDHLFAGHGVSEGDVIEGGPGNDRLEGDRILSSRVYGGSGDDLLQGANGPDRMYGGDGNDRIESHRGRDVVVGGRGNDELLIGGRSRSAVCGPGRDKIGFERLRRPGVDCEQFSIASGPDYQQFLAVDRAPTVRGRAFVFRLVCRRDNPHAQQPCIGSISIRTPSRGRKANIATRRFRIRFGRARTVAIPIPARFRARWRRAHRASLRIVVAVPVLRDQWLVSVPFRVPKH